MSLKIITVSDGFGSETVPSVVDPATSQVVHKSLTQGEIDLGYVVLPVAPQHPETGTLSWLGVGQQLGSDFEINGMRMDFLSSLQEKLSAGDYITIQYQ